MAAKSKAAAAATFTPEQVEAMIARAVGKALAISAPPAPVTHGLRPCDCVLVRDDADELTDEQAKYKRSAGVVERLEGGAVVVDMDLDHKRVSFSPSQLRTLKA
jgi:hypothetical protein